MVLNTKSMSKYLSIPIPIILLIVGFSLINSNIYSQIRTLKGVIKDDQGITIPGVAILEKGTTNGVTSDINGAYAISVKDTRATVLIFSYIGYELQEIAIAA